MIEKIKIRLGKYMQSKDFKNAAADFQLIENDPIQKKGEELSKYVFNGGPAHKFSKVGRLYLITLLRLGITPDSKVLDVGCGALRGGYWLIHFLKKDAYYGIEPNKKMLARGIEVMLDDEIMADKTPHFDHNDAFDFSSFGVKFDYVIARSIWTHTSKDQILTMLDQFLLNSTENGVFLASYLRSNVFMKAYKGNKWIGKSHESEEKGVVYHDLAWLKSVCQERGLRLEELTFDYMDQIWLKVCRQ